MMRLGIGTIRRKHCSYANREYANGGGTRSQARTDEFCLEQGGNMVISVSPTDSVGRSAISPSGRNPAFLRYSKLHTFQRIMSLQCSLLMCSTRLHFPPSRSATAKPPMCS